MKDQEIVSMSSRLYIRAPKRQIEDIYDLLIDAGLTFKNYPNRHIVFRNKQFAVYPIRFEEKEEQILAKMILEESKFALIVNESFEVLEKQWLIDKEKIVKADELLLLSHQYSHHTITTATEEDDK